MKRLLAMAAVLLLTGCGASDPVGPAMASCVKYFFAQAAEGASSDTDLTDWATDACNANLKKLGEAEFVKLWSD